jgi:hypothetical protein
LREIIRSQNSVLLAVLCASCPDQKRAFVLETARPA